MKCKKVIAAVLCATMLVGVAGCKKSNKKDIEEIESLMEDYVDALNDCDVDGIVKLTDWDDDDEIVSDLEWYLDADYYGRAYGVVSEEIFKEITKSITISYDSEDIEIEDDKAVVKVKYELKKWEPILYSNYGTYTADDYLEEIKKCDDTVSYKGKITFKFDDGEWLISKLSGIDDLFDYRFALPYYEVEPDPVYTEPEPTDTTYDVYSENYERAIQSFVDVLIENSDGILAVEDYYDMYATAIYDVDGDGIPELIFISSNDPDDSEASATLYVYEYNEYAGEAVCVIEYPNIMYMAADGGSFMLFHTEDELILITAGGEESMYHYEMDIFDADPDTLFQKIFTLKRIEYYDYDDDSYSYEYYFGDEDVIQETDQDFYEDMVNYYIDKAQIVIAKNYTPYDGEIEAPLNEVYESGFASYDYWIDICT